VRGYEIRKNDELIGFTNGISFLDSVGAGEKPRYDVIAVDRSSNILGFSCFSVQIGEWICL